MKRRQGFKPADLDLLESRIVLSSSSKISLGHIDRELGIPNEVSNTVKISSPFHAIKISSPGHKNETLGSWIDRAWKRLF